MPRMIMGSLVSFVGADCQAGGAEGSRWCERSERPTVRLTASAAGGGTEGSRWCERSERPTVRLTRVCSTPAGSRKAGLQKLLAPCPAPAGAAILAYTLPVVARFARTTGYRPDRLRRS